MEILIIGGTRNAGHFLTLELLQHGHKVTVFNRGRTPDELPDVVQAIVKVIETGSGKGRVYNISQDETLSIEEFLALLATMAGCTLSLAQLPREVLENTGLLPDCSPFSDSWMSELDNQRSRMELGMQYTPPSVYLQKMVSYFTSHPLPLPEGYRRRDEEIRLATQIGSKL